MGLEILKDLDDLNLKKLERKTLLFIGGIFGTYIVVSLVTKFIADNWSFRIKKISNLPAPQPLVVIDNNNPQPK